MINSIKYFEEKCISKFENLEDKFLKDPTKMAEYVIGLTEELHQLGLHMIQESLEMMDQMLQDSPIRRRKWLVEAHKEKQLITSLGTVSFTKTLFTSRETGKSEYFLDRILGMEAHERMTEDAEAKMLEEADLGDHTCDGWVPSGKVPDKADEPHAGQEREYILSNWRAAKIRLKQKEGIQGCSAEGHVSHVLSSRMSSRPMGWSIVGASKMAQLRAYYLNGRDMLELVRYQKKELLKAAGAEYEVLSAGEKEAVFQCPYMGIVKGSGRAPAGMILLQKRRIWSKVEPRVIA